MTLLLRAHEDFLPFFDSMLREALMEILVSDGISIHANTAIARIDRSADASLTLTTASGETVAGYDALIWAVGRLPNTEALDLAAAGVALDARG
ncbi:MAG: FAD-dependent oxidoreductase, partial [Gammaproteobacteria bacterium]|nr:FAD-dependent oxidoreductase [Gammaproteobacteria bacterium]